MVDKDCMKCISKVGWLGLWTSVFLALLQGTVGFASGSKACLAIALQSMCDIITAGSILICQQVSNKPANDEFHYGYGKVEFVAAAFTALLFGTVTIYLTETAVKQLMGAPGTMTDFSPILVGVLSLIANEVLFAYMRCVALKAKSQTIMANAWANRVGSYASGVLILSSLGAWFGLQRLDSIATLVMVVLIAKTLLSTLIEAGKGLLDHSANAEYGEKVGLLLDDVPGVMSVGRIKTKRVGTKVWAEVEISVAAETIREGQQIADKAQSALLAAIDEMDQVVVHFRPSRERYVQAN